MKYVEFRHLSSEIVAPEVVEQKPEKSVKSWLSSYFMAPAAKSPETEIVDFIKESGKVEEDNKSYWMSDASVKRNREKFFFFLSVEKSEFSDFSYSGNFYGKFFEIFMKILSEKVRNFQI